MDYYGQWLAELLMTLIWLLVGFLALLYSYAIGDQTPAWMSLGFMSLLASILFVPDWPFWNRHPLTWLPAEKAE